MNSFNAPIETEIARLNKIVTVLMDQVEAGMNAHGSDFGLFQTTIMLEAQVQERARQLEAALHAIAKSNRDLSTAKDAAEGATAGLKTVIENISEAFVQFNSDDRVVLCNDVFRRLWQAGGITIEIGQSFEDILGRVVAAGLVVGADQTWVAARLGAHRKASANSVMRLTDGRWIKISERRLETGGILGIYSDITELKRREQERLDLELARKSRLLQATLDTIVQGVSVFDAQGSLIAWNKRFVDLLHLPKDMAKVGMRYAQMARFDRPDPAREDDGLPTVPALYGHRTAWNTILDVRRSAMPDGGFVTTYTDVTEEKRNLQEYRIAATALEAQQGIVITDPGGVILRVNKAFTETTGYRPEEVIGKTPRILKSNRHDKAFYDEMWDRLQRTGQWQGEIWDRRKNGDIYPKWLTITAVHGDRGEVTHYVGTHTDITQRKASEEEIKQLAFFDPLTHLPNRRLLMDRLRRALAASTRTGAMVALLFIDLDNFKTLNDTEGHEKGDLLLQQVGRRLSGCVREGDTVARLGGDEFVVMLEGLSTVGCEAVAQTQTVGEKILSSLSQPYHVSGHEHHSTASIGITLYSDRRQGLDELLKQADLAMYQAKAAGRNTMLFFDAKMQESVVSRANLEKSFRRGLQRREFLLFYQPQVDGEGTLTGAEALVRWQHPVRGLVAPMDFIPFAEQSGLILPLGQWVLETACSQLVHWARRYGRTQLTVAVNVSARQFRQHDFVDQILRTLDKTGADPSLLKLELTESLLLDDVRVTIDKMMALKSYGVRFSLDDFGTGYSSLSYLKDLPIEQLKIDKSFVRDVLTDPSNAAIAHTIVSLGKHLGLSVIAEGVETEAQRGFLASHGCTAYQGYLFGHALPLHDYEALLAGVAVPGNSQDLAGDDARRPG